MVCVFVMCQGLSSDLGSQLFEFHICKEAIII